MANSCRLNTLFASQHMTVSYCDGCALFHVDVGSVTLRLSEAEFIHWSEGLSFAQTRYMHTFAPPQTPVTLM